MISNCTKHDLIPETQVLTEKTCMFNNEQEMLQYVTNAPERPLILTLIPGCDLEQAKEPESCKGHKLSFCFTFLCDPDLGQRTLILIMKYHLIIIYLFTKSN